MAIMRTKPVARQRMTRPISRQKASVGMNLSRGMGMTSSPKPISGGMGSVSKANTSLRNAYNRNTSSLTRALNQQSSTANMKLQQAGKRGVPMRRTMRTPASGLARQTKMQRFR